MLPPTFSCDVRIIFTPRSPNRRASWRCTMVAPTCDLMSSPTIGRPAFLKRLPQYSSLAMKTGMQLTKPQPASSTCSTYHLVACPGPRPEGPLGRRPGAGRSRGIRDVRPCVVGSHGVLRLPPPRPDHLLLQ